MKRRWNPSLHPRGKGGLFARKGTGSTAASSAERIAKKAAQAPADKEQAKLRRKQNRSLYTRAAFNTGVGAAAITVGHYSKDHRYTAAGVARIGQAGAEAHYTRKAVKRTTSKEFHKLPEAQRQAELDRVQRNIALHNLAGMASNYALYKTLPGKVEKIRATNKAKLAAQYDWEDKVSANQDKPFTKFQGPGPGAKARAAGRSRRNKGVYDVRGSSKIGRKAPTGRGRAGDAAFRARRSAAGAASKARSTVVRRRSAPGTAVVVRRR